MPPAPSVLVMCLVDRLYLIYQSLDGEWKIYHECSETPLWNSWRLVYFCGTYGDPMMNTDVTEIAHWFRSRNPNLEIGIHTNGGVGRVEDYRAMAKIVDFISFGMDGLSDTNHIYRRRVRWDQVMERSRAYIESGGQAIWDFIVFEHNQHQVELARTFAHTMGFKQFNVKRTSRFLNRRHELMAYQSVQDKNGSRRVSDISTIKESNT